MDTDKVDKNFKLSVRNIKNIDLLSYKGINAALILKRKTLILSKEALTHLEEKYK